MKKKIVITWVLVIAFAFCTVPVFAQQKLSNLNATKVERKFFSLEQWEGNVQLYTSSGNKYSMPAGYPKQFSGNGNDYLETGSNSYGYIFGYTPNAFGAPTSQIFIKVSPNSRIDISWNNAKKDKVLLTLTKGSWEEDKGAKKLEQFDQFMTFLSSVDSQKIANQVANWKKSGNRTNDQLADYVIEQKATKTGFYGAISGIGGALSGPNQFLALIADWVVQAEMAYAIACVYQPKPPTSAEFKKDLYLLLCDTDVQKKALISMGIDVSVAVTRSVASQIISSQMTSIMKDIAAQQTNKLAAKAGASGVKAIPVLSSFVDASVNFANAKSFGTKAKNYYK